MTLQLKDANGKKIGNEIKKNLAAGVGNAMDFKETEPLSDFIEVKRFIDTQDDDKVKLEVKVQYIDKVVIEEKEFTIK